MRRLVCVVLVMISAVVGQAQAPSEGLTETDRLRIENTNLFETLAAFVEEADACRGQLARPRADANRAAAADRRAKLKADIEAAHVGFRFVAETGRLEKDEPKGR